MLLAVIFFLQSQECVYRFFSCPPATETFFLWLQSKSQHHGMSICRGASLSSYCAHHIPFFKVSRRKPEAFSFLSWKVVGSSFFFFFKFKKYLSKLRSPGTGEKQFLSESLLLGVLGTVLRLWFPGSNSKCTSSPCYCCDSCLFGGLPWWLRW